jgi:DNA-directed RNA polymerase subunit RPC12/RpoP
MIFKCSQCQSRVATPTMFDHEIKTVECGNCGKVLSVLEHGEVVPPSPTIPLIKNVSSSETKTSI